MSRSSFLPGLAMWRALSLNLLSLSSKKEAHNEAPRNWPPQSPSRFVDPSALERLFLGAEAEGAQQRAWAILGWAASLEVRGHLAAWATIEKNDVQPQLEAIFAVLKAHTSDASLPMLDFVREVLLSSKDEPSQKPATAEMSSKTPALQQAVSDRECVDWLLAHASGEEAVLMAWKYQALENAARATFERELLVFEETLHASATAQWSQGSAAKGREVAIAAHTESANESASAAKLLRFPVRAQKSPSPVRFALAAASDTELPEVRDPAEGEFCGRATLTRSGAEEADFDIEVYRFDDVWALYADHGALHLEANGQILPVLMATDGYAEFACTENVARLRVACTLEENQSAWQSLVEV